MNPKSIFKLFSPKEKAQAVALRQISTLAISLAVLSLFALTACLQVPASVPVVEEVLPAIAPAAVTEPEPASDSAFLDANPELLEANLPAEGQAMTDSALLGANPELAIAGRYADGVEKRAEAADLAANPELLKAYPPTLGQKMSETMFLANNPELMVARRYAAVESEIDPDRDLGLLDFFTVPNETNEQPVIRRNANDDIGLLEFYFKPDRQSSVVFDIESLRQSYFQDWTSEADAADAVKPAIEPGQSGPLYQGRVYGYGADTVKPAIESETSPDQTLDFWLEALRRTYNRQAETAHPGMVIRPVRFDIEGLRQTFFQDWASEADTTDPSPLTQPLSNIIEPPATYNEVTISTILAANPELSAAQRAEAIVEWNHRHHPGR